MATKQKQTGAHFTPPELAAFVAKKLVEQMEMLEGPLRVLDPACGDGNLLVAISKAMPSQLRSRVTLVGLENDADSFAAVQTRLRDHIGISIELIRGDFLDLVPGNDLFSDFNGIENADVIIANPPYVRTQVIGAKHARQLAESYGLTGRVDLYQVFMVGMTKCLRPGGLLGVITSNRFLTTKAGETVRRILRTSFDLTEVVDLGDTKLFDAAVLPALIFGSKCTSPAFTTKSPAKDPEFIRVYEDRGSEVAISTNDSILELVRKGSSGTHQTRSGKFKISAGKLEIPKDDSEPWRLNTSDEGGWIRLIQNRMSCKIGDIAKVRVGIKTTADNVFIRSDWDRLDKGERPEEKHLRSLLSQVDAARWIANEAAVPARRVLYTHEVVAGRRRAIRFNESSPTWKYLLKHRDQLSGRNYVLEAGRAWYEVWVPQDPDAWKRPKVVFPDISPEAKFFLDTSGHVVDGNCYWVTVDKAADEDILYLIVGLANSSLMAKYHDLAFQNRLYAGRRRYLTQYVQEYPLPDIRKKESRRIIELVRSIGSFSGTWRDQVEREIDETVSAAFGIEHATLTD